MNQNQDGSYGPLFQDGSYGPVRTASRRTFFEFRLKLLVCLFFRLKVEAILLTEGKTMLKDSDNAGLINIGPVFTRWGP